MKKATAVLLTVLMLFSVFSGMFAFAADTYTITFVDYDGTELATVTAAEGEIVRAPENPSRPATDTVKYVFKGWIKSGDDTIYHQGTIPLANSDVTYTAVYGEQKINENQTFWQFVKSIFDRINRIFEYFYLIFQK